MNQKLLEGLTPEQVAKAKTRKSTDELLKLARDEGIQPNDDQLEAVSGSSRLTSFIDPYECPKCGSGNIKKGGNTRKCKKCGHSWKEDSYNPH